MPASENRSTPRTLFIPALLLSLVPAGAPRAGTSDGWQDTVARVAELRAQHHIPAAALVLVTGDEPPTIIVWGDGVDVHTPFRVGSISKTFTALAALTLVVDGHITLNENLAPWIGDAYQNPFAPTQRVSLHQLLELTAGFSDLTGPEFDDNRYLSLTAALDLAPSGRTLRWPPGLQHSYSNVPPGLTALLIERIANQTFEDYVQQHVLRPLGMFESSYLPLAGLPGGFRADGRTPIPYWNMTYRAFGALNAPPADMAAFLQAATAGDVSGRRAVFTPEVRHAFFTPATSLGARSGLAVGYAAGAYGWVNHGHLFWGHGGDADGYRSRYGLLRVAARGYFVAINTDNPGALSAMTRTIEASLLRDVPAPPQPAAVELPTGLAGTYYPSRARLGLDRWRRGESGTIEVRSSGDHLTVVRRGARIRLIPIGAGRFVRPGDPVASVVFARDAGGALYMQGELGSYVRLDARCPRFIPRCDSQ